MPEYRCPACQDTGNNSKGGICFPCKKKGRNPQRSRVLSAVGGLFDRLYIDNRLPSRGEVGHAVKWAYRPRVYYVVGSNMPGGGFAGVYGPIASLTQIQEYVPEDEEATNVYIVEVTDATYGAEPKRKPIAKWNGEAWVGKRSQ